ncbi:MAG: hypothetical protein KDD60_07640 [Bdellovibrionales bacterium]|nr:hypothetical protein [Bdellovibrionales bacterium]
MTSRDHHRRSERDPLERVQGERPTALNSVDRRIEDLSHPLSKSDAALEDFKRHIRFSMELGVLDHVIAFGCPIFYRERDFADADTVNEFLTIHRDSPHRKMRTAICGLSMAGYLDPCTCLLTGHGPKSFQPQLKDASQVLEWVQSEKNEGKVLDLIFVPELLYPEVHAGLKLAALDTELIVGCTSESSSSAQHLRQNGIPAVDDNDFYRISPFNSIVALVAFGESVVSRLRPKDSE